MITIVVLITVGIFGALPAGEAGASHPEFYSAVAGWGRLGFKDGTCTVVPRENKMLVERPKAGEVTLTRGLTDSTSFEEWISTVLTGDLEGARKGGAIVVFDQMGIELKRCILTNCWSKTLELGTLKAGDTSVLREKLTITDEGCEPA